MKRTTTLLTLAFAALATLSLPMTVSAHGKYDSHRPGYGQGYHQGHHHKGHHHKGHRYKGHGHHGHGWDRDDLRAVPDRGFYRPWYKKHHRHPHKHRRYCGPSLGLFYDGYSDRLRVNGGFCID